MSSQSCAAYRGYSIDVEVTANNVVSLSGRELRYSVSWSIISLHVLSTPIASLPERLEFLSPDDAFSYGERRAHTFIDGSLLSDVQ